MTTYIRVVAFDLKNKTSREELRYMQKKCLSKQSVITLNFNFYRLSHPNEPYRVSKSWQSHILDKSHNYV